MLVAVECHNTQSNYAIIVYESMMSVLGGGL